MTHVPTVDEILANTAIGGGFHNFVIEGVTIILPKADLQSALEDAYDPSCPDWVQYVDI